MANNIGYSFEIRYNDSDIKNWLNFQIQDGVILSDDKQSGYTETVSPKELKLDASYGTQEMGNDGNPLSARTAFIYFRQNDTNDTTTIPITQYTDQSSTHTVGNPEIDAKNTGIKIFAANNFNFSNIIPFSGGSVYIKAQYIQTWQQKYEKKDKYGNQSYYYLPVSADTKIISGSSAFTSNAENVSFSGDGSGLTAVIISGNPTEQSRQIIISASYSGCSGETPPIIQEGAPAEFKFIISTNISGSTAIFKDFHGKHDYETEANQESNGKYYAEYKFRDTVEPKLYGYVTNENYTYSNGSLKLFNEDNNLVKIGGVYTWANASASGDTIQITGLYVGTENGFSAKTYTEANPLILSGNGADNYIELISGTDTVSSAKISANTKEGSVSTISISDSVIKITVPKIDSSATTTVSSTTISADTKESNSSATSNSDSESAITAPTTDSSATTTTSADNVVKSVSSSVEIYSTLDPQAKQKLIIKQIIE